MKRGLLLCGLILLAASVAFAQLPGGAVGVYSNDQGSSCDFTDGVTVSYFLFHIGTPGATAIEFKLDLTGFGFSNFFGDNSPFTLKQGNFHEGCSIAYGACLNGEIFLGAATFLSTQTTAACHDIFVVQHPIPSSPGATTPLAVDCADALVPTSGSKGTFNDGSCACTGSVPVHESSWGQIKSLYN